jgi:hypothetical protein
MLGGGTSAATRSDAEPPRAPCRRCRHWANRRQCSNALRRAGGHAADAVRGGRRQPLAGHRQGHLGAGQGHGRARPPQPLGAGGGGEHPRPGAGTSSPSTGCCSACGRPARGAAEAFGAASRSRRSAQRRRHARAHGGARQPLARRAGPDRPGRTLRGGRDRRPAVHRWRWARCSPCSTPRRRTAAPRRSTTCTATTCSNAWRSAKATGLHLPARWPSSELLTRVVHDGPLPRKTFSMGEAHEKRYYVEARRIRHA